MQIQSLPPAIKNRARQLEMPVLYREAVAALERCSTMDEGKYYADKADALAAWAKIYGSDEDSKAAARLKLRAYARMGVLALELRPGNRFYEKFGVGTKKGANALLREHGLNSAQSSAALALAKMPNVKLEKASEKAMSPHAAYRALGVQQSRCSDSWKKFAHGGSSTGAFLSFCRNTHAKDLALGLEIDEIKKARKIVVEVWEWLDAFEQALPR